MAARVFRCNLCQKDIGTMRLFTTHIYNTHSLQLKDYYDKYIKKEGEGLCIRCGKPTNFKSFCTGYHSYCSQKCRALTSNETLIHRCKLCDIDISFPKFLFRRKFKDHVSKSHNISPEQYYRKYISGNPQDGFCKMCGKPTKFFGIFNGFAKFCSYKCGHENSNIEFKKEFKEFKEQTEPELIKKKEERLNYEKELLDKVKRYDNTNEMSKFLINEFNYDDIANVSYTPKTYSFNVRKTYIDDNEFEPETSWL